MLGISEDEDGLFANRHGWIGDALFTLAAYADRNGLVDLYGQLCAVMASDTVTSLRQGSTQMLTPALANNDSDDDRSSHLRIVHPKH